MATLKNQQLAQMQIIEKLSQKQVFLGNFPIIQNSKYHIFGYLKEFLQTELNSVVEKTQETVTGVVVSYRLWMCTHHYIFFQPKWQSTDQNHF